MLDEAIRTLKPTTPEEVCALVAEAGASARHIEVMGGGTKRAIGTLDRIDQVISTQRLDRIVDYSPEELVLTVQPGVRVADLERLTAAWGQMLAFEPPNWTRLLSALGEPTIGGVLGATPPGPRRVRAGRRVTTSSASRL